jgi:hypothetical protein
MRDNGDTGIRADGLTEDCEYQYWTLWCVDVLAEPIWLDIC